MTPEEREQLASQLTVITAPLPPTAPKALPAKAGEPSEETPVPSKAPTRRLALPGRWRGMRLGVFAAIICLALLGTGLAEGLAPTAFHFGGQILGLVPAPPTPTPVPAKPAADSIFQHPTISVVEVSRVLQSVNSPILPYAGDVYAYGIQYGIDPVFALAFWMKESREASDGSVAAVDHNPGYTEGLGTDTRVGRWAYWATWPEGIAGWYRYMRVFFIDGLGLTTVESILPIYAPSTENNTSGYIAFVLQKVADWRAESAADG
ncbi:MAG TPA: hypothetical protein VKT82_23870 [Ktedonobacterales bacterium]|nr:hypothetical protein [Ktedonobacterales bacterium]